MKKLIGMMLLVGSSACLAQSKSEMPLPPVVFRPTAVRADEKPVVVETEAKIAADNGLFRRVETTITFTNPNGRAFEGELEFPVPEGATVCGYRLEVDGSMVPGVVVAKEEARVAFENEKRKGVDPGIVEHVKGRVWKTRIYPLMPGVPRKARVDYIVADEKPAAFACEKFGDEIFTASPQMTKAETKAERLRGAKAARIYWDASMSRQGKVAADRNLLECLPEAGKFTLVVFRNVIEEPREFGSRADLLKAVDALAYDGGTCLEEVRCKAEAVKGAEVFIFSDEYAEPKPRAVRVRKLAADEKPPAEPKEGSLLATAWAAQRVEDLGESAEAHREELVEIGRKYGVASPVTSLIVLESLDQYKTYKIEPPKCMGFYEEWKKWRAAEDDPIAAERAKAEHRQELLRYWEERVKWWKDPIPPKATPKSGLFDGVAAASREEPARQRDGVVMSALRSVGRAVRSVVSPSRNEMVCRASADVTGQASAERSMAAEARSSSASFAAAVEEDEERARPAERLGESKSAQQSGRAAAQATVTIAAWNPETPYLKAMDAAGKGGAYGEYLKQREVHGTSPAFYLDCSGWFFKAKETMLAIRILSNLSEMKLEDVGLWRTMGWRLREAGAYDEAVKVFRHVLKMRGEEPQSKRDLALVLTERGKDAWDTDRQKFHNDIMEAIGLLRSAAFEPSARRSGRRGNDLQTSVLALEELNGLGMWWESKRIRSPFPWRFDDGDAVFRRGLPLDLRIMLSWDTDETDVDLHVLEPDGEEAYYGHRRTSTGGFVSEDVTTGYGPEEYLRKEAPKGVYKILAHYYASHRQALTGAAVVTATVYTNWGRTDEKRQVLSFRLDKPKDKCSIGEIKVD